jgi:hypothetical protein
MEVFSNRSEETLVNIISLDDDKHQTVIKPS